MLRDRSFSNQIKAKEARSVFWRYQLGRIVVLLYSRCSNQKGKNKARSEAARGVSEGESTSFKPTSDKETGNNIVGTEIFEFRS